MATSAATLSTIVKTLADTYHLDQGEMVLLLSGRGLLPKKMLVAPKEAKAVTKWASKAAQELADEHGVTLELSKASFKGSGKDDKVTVKDVKSFLEAPIKKVKASPSALKYARDNGLDISRIATGKGTDGRILLKDVQELSVRRHHGPGPHIIVEEEAEEEAEEEEADSDEGGLVLSPSAAKLVKHYDLDEEDLEHIKGSGGDGKIMLRDLKDLIAELDKE